ncbi:probable subtilisin-like serine protease [Claviceps purpurea 20.1]|uniref:Probable subtilisin-like serine protease n=1 Tax=Claviceps purpurea (strain 20.1) TaxID=1111077 RepID=M1VUC5_CLAP2|nr:probable subtilisin-like serine protease [Claviceps purpurea 20.1]
MLLALLSKSSSTLPAPGAISAASMVDAETGETFIKALKGGKKLTLQMVGPKNAELRILTANNTMSGGAVSAFSSWGPTFDMRSKPQYSAIGGTVLSTFPRAKGSYAVPSGTSMACPQAAGIIALIRQVRGAITPQEIEYLLSSNSNPQLFNDGTKFYDYLAPIQQQGGDLSLEFTLRNTDRKPATYKITHVPAITMYSLQPFPNEAVHAAATLQFSETSITLRGGQTKTIKVSATPPEGLDAKRLALWSG